MKIDREFFFATVRGAVFDGSMSQDQVDGCNVILSVWEAIGYTDLRWLAYALSTTKHETWNTMQPVIEAQRPGEVNIPLEQALARLDSWWRSGKARAAGVRSRYWARDALGRSWLGRGYIQLTHLENYEKVGELIGEDLVSDPERARIPEIAAKILLMGCAAGTFRRKSFSDYFDRDTTDWTGARNIVNGDVKANGYKIGLVAVRFLGALREGAEEVEPAPPPPPAPKPKPKPSVPVAEGAAGATVGVGAGVGSIALLEQFAPGWGFLAGIAIGLVLAYGVFVLLQKRKKS